MNPWREEVREVEYRSENWPKVPLPRKVRNVRAAEEKKGLPTLCFPTPTIDTVTPEEAPIYPVTSYEGAHHAKVNLLGARHAQTMTNVHVHLSIALLPRKIITFTGYTPPVW